MKQRIFSFKTSCVITVTNFAQSLTGSTCTMMLLALFLFLQIWSSRAQPLDFKRSQTCDYEEIRRGAIRHIRLSQENIRLSEEYLSVARTLNKTQSEKNELHDKLTSIRNFMRRSYKRKDKGNLHYLNDHLVFIVTSRKDWYKSEEYCNRLDASLVKMNTNMTEALRQRGGNEDYWIGGINQNGKWFWVDKNITVEPITWTAWVPGQPDLKAGILTQKCIQIRGRRAYQWDNDLCYISKRFICAKPLF